jgi:hypothetical protein
MRSGVKAHVHTDLSWGDESECVVMWRTVDESAWAISRTSDRLRLRRGDKGPVTDIDQLWSRLYPGQSLEAMPMTDRAQVTWELPP